MRKYLLTFLLFTFLIGESMAEDADNSPSSQNDEPISSTITMGDRTFQAVSHTDEYDVIKIRDQYQKIYRPKEAIAGSTFMKELMNQRGTIQKRTEEISKNPNDPLPHVALGNYYTLWGLYEKALKEYEEAIKLQPHDTRILRGATVLALECFETEKAVTYAKEAVELDPKDILLNQILAVAYGRNGDYLKCEKTVKKERKLSANQENQQTDFTIGNLFEYSDPVMNYLGHQKVRDRYKTVTFSQGTAYEIDSKGNPEMGDINSVMKK